MYMSSIKFDFNTALSGVTSEDGRWEKEKHDAMAKQIRGRIMSMVDGIDGMSIDRYDMTVKYQGTIVSREKVVEAVRGAISWIAETNKDVFPLRGDKEPEAIAEVPRVKQPTGRTKVTAVLPSDLYVIPASEKKRNKLHEEIGSELLDFNGIRSYGIYINSVTLTIDESVATPEAAKEHIQAVLDRFTHDEDDDAPRKFLPFAPRYESVQVDWEIERLML